MNKIKLTISLILILFLFITTSIYAAKPPKHYETLYRKDKNGYTYEYVKNDPFKARIYTLKNGFKVYLAINKSKPNIRTYIVVKTGSIYDPYNFTGLAHITEHMMFKGTKKIGTLNWEKEKPFLEKISKLYEQYRMEKNEGIRKKIYEKINNLSVEAAKYVIPNEYDKLTQEIGAEDVNAYTSYERTVYECSIPSNKLERWTKLESERFSYIVPRLFNTELQAIYEEYNMDQDNDWDRADNALMSGLFSIHPYGRPTIGKYEHITNPSIRQLQKFWERYYVPNNMALCISGDLDFEKTIILVDKYWGNIKKRGIPTIKMPAERAITRPVAKNVYGPEAEFVEFAYRFNGYKSEDRKYVIMINEILDNGIAGLINLDLLHKQKVLHAGSDYYFMKDYGVHEFYGAPKKGQSLDDVKNLLLQEIEKIKRGNFDDWLLEAIINNAKLGNIFIQEENVLADFFVDEFIQNENWIDYVTLTDKLSKITKKDIMKFANEHYRDNYVIVYKRKGKPEDIHKIKSISAAPTPINHDVQSAYYKNFIKQKPMPIQPVFVDYKKEIKISKLKNKIEFSYIKNKVNKFFRLYYIIDMGSDHIKKLPLAVNYLQYLGTSKYSPEDLKKELYKLGLQMDVFAGDDRCYVYLEGVNEYEKEGIKLLEDLLHNAKPDKKAYINFVNDILKQRERNKSSKYSILWNGLYNYGVYGKKSAFRDVLSEEELKNTDPEELVELVKDITSYKHKIFYYGPDSLCKIKNLLAQYHKVPKIFIPYPPKKKYTELPTTENKVYFVNYDMDQVDLIMLSKDTKFNKDLLPYIKLYNEYYGGSMASVVFQGLRESKGLVYSAYSGFDVPSNANKSHYVFAFLETSPVKLKNAIGSMSRLINNMPEYKNQFELSKEAVLKSIESDRIIKSNIYWSYQRNLRLGINYDYRKDVYNAIKELSLKNLKNFFNAHVKGKKYTFLVMGNKDKIDMEILKSMGKYKELTLEEIFGY